MTEAMLINRTKDKPSYRTFIISYQCDVIFVNFTRSEWKKKNNGETGKGEKSIVHLVVIK